ncbi:MAG: WD40 repeat domain-containing protein [Asticcacaulis sp.]|nr:WD40 repeat domain-containing protein [Asticcacaulis sp.]
MAMTFGLAGGLGYVLKTQALRRSETLTVAAQAALDQSDFEGAARFALAAMKGHDLPLIGFDATRAELILAGAAADSPAMGPALPGSEGITQVALSPDGQNLAAIRNDVDPAGHRSKTSVLIWDLKTQRLVGPGLYSPSDYPWAVQWLPDNHTLVLSGRASVTLWDAASGKAVGSPFACECRSVFVATDRRRLVVVDQTPERGRMTYRSATGMMPAPMGPPARLHVLDIDNHREIAAFALPDPDADPVAFIDDTVLFRKKTALWQQSVVTGAVRPAGALPEDVGNIVLSADHRFLAAKSGESSIAVMSFPDLKPVIFPIFTGQSFGDMAFSPDNRHLAVSDDDKTTLYDIDAGEAVGRIMYRSGDSAKAQFTKDGSVLVTSARDGSIRLWNAAKDLPVRTLHLPFGPMKGDFEHSFSTTRSVWMYRRAANAFVLGADGDLTRWNLASGTQLRIADAMQRTPSVLEAFSDDGGLGIFVDKSSLSLVSVDDGRVVRSGIAVPPEDGQPAVSFDRSWLLMQHYDGVDVLDLTAPGAAWRTIHVRRADDVVVQRDGVSIDIVGWDGRVHEKTHQWWDLRTLKPITPDADMRDTRLHTYVGNGALRVAVDDDIFHPSAYFTDATSELPVGLPLSLPGHFGPDAFFAADDRFIYTLSAPDHILRSYALDPALTMRGQALIDHACRVTLGGGRSRFSDDEMKRTPLLQAADRDSCAGIAARH